jgi:hypothetical protein
MLYKRVELTEGATVQFVGVYALKWKYGEWGMPEWGFVEFEGDFDQLMEEHKALQELLAVRDAEAEELREESEALRARLEEAYGAYRRRGQAARCVIARKNKRIELLEEACRFVVAMVGQCMGQTVAMDEMMEEAVRRCLEVEV